jgi:hypothetical protein
VLHTLVENVVATINTIIVPSECVHQRLTCTRWWIM